MLRDTHQEQVALDDVVEHAAPEGQAVDAIELAPQLVPDGGAGQFAGVAGPGAVKNQSIGVEVLRNTSASVMARMSFSAPVRLLLVPSQRRLTWRTGPEVTATVSGCKRPTPQLAGGNLEGSSEISTLTRAKLRRSHTRFARLCLPTLPVTSRNCEAR